MNTATARERRASFGAFEERSREAQVQLWDGGLFTLPDGSSLELPHGTFVESYDNRWFCMLLPDGTQLRLSPPEDRDCSYFLEVFGTRRAALPSLNPPKSWTGRVTRH